MRNGNPRARSRGTDAKGCQAPRAGRTGGTVVALRDVTPGSGAGRCFAVRELVGSADVMPDGIAEDHEEPILSRNLRRLVVKSLVIGLPRGNQRRRVECLGFCRRRNNLIGGGSVAGKYRRVV